MEVLCCAAANPDLILEFVTMISKDSKAYNYKPVTRLPAVFRVEELPFLPGQTDAPSTVSLSASSSLNASFTYRKLQRIPGPFLNQVIPIQP
jgi:hypothetical protein